MSAGRSSRTVPHSTSRLSRIDEHTITEEGVLVKILGQADGRLSRVEHVGDAQVPVPTRYARPRS
jgi:hypothetical protein